jgi:signal peptidase I
MNREETGKRPGRLMGLLRRYFQLAVQIAIGVFFVLTFVVQAYHIPSGSMEPTLLVGDFLLVNRLIYAGSRSGLDRALLPCRAAKRGDIVVFKDPAESGEDFVKRVIGLPGDRLEIVDKQVYINDIPLDEPYKFHADSFIFTAATPVSPSVIKRDNFGPLTMPPECVFAMGDNRDDSDDSRFRGPLSIRNLKGRPWLIYFSFEVARSASQKAKATGRLRNTNTFIPKFRPERIFRIVR